MKNFYCNICNEDVDLKNGKCPKCGTNWEKIITEGTNSEASLLNDYISLDNSSNIERQAVDDVEETYEFYLKIASIAKYIVFVLAALLALCSIIYLEDTDGTSLLLIFAVLVLIGYAFVIEKNLKWKAYMLKLTYTNTKHNKNK